MNASQLINQSSLETWKTVEGWPRYEVSNLGRVRSLWFVPSRIIKGNTDNDGYRKMVLTNDGGKKRTFKVATLIAAAFLGPRPEGMVVAHNNGNRIDDRADNLIYKTQLANIHDKWRHGTMASGERHGMRKLTAAQVREIRSSTETPSTLKLRFGVGKCTIHAIRSGKAWAGL